MKSQFESEFFLDDYFSIRRQIAPAVHWERIKSELNYLRNELEDLKEIYCINSDCEDEEQ